MIYLFVVLYLSLLAQPEQCAQSQPQEVFPFFLFKTKTVIAIATANATIAKTTQSINDILFYLYTFLPFIVNIIDKTTLIITIAMLVNIDHKDQVANIVHTTYTIELAIKDVNIQKSKVIFNLPLPSSPLAEATVAKHGIVVTLNTINAIMVGQSVAVATPISFPIACMRLKISPTPFSVATT